MGRIIYIDPPEGPLRYFKLVDKDGKVIGSLLYEKKTDDLLEELRKQAKEQLNAELIEV